MKLSLGDGGAKEFLAQHCEKMIAVAVVVTAVCFVYAGFQEEGLDKTKDPAVLFQNAEAALSHVNTTDATGALLKDFTMAQGDYIENVKKGNQAVDSGRYVLNVPLKTPAEPPHTKRPDPKLFAPKNALAYVVTGPLELAGTADPLADLDNAEEPKVEVAKAKPKPKRDTNRNTRGSSSAAMMMMDDSMDDIEESPLGMGMEMGMEAGEEGIGGMAGGSTNWKLPSVYQETYKPTASGGSMGAMGMNTQANETTAGFRSVTFVMVSALAPFQEQWEEFETSLMNATGYIAERDRPNYFYIQVERAEVTDPKQPADQLKWSLLKNDLLDKFAEPWTGKVAEAIQNDYVDELLAYPMPPVPLRDMTNLLTRSELPIKKEKTNANEVAKAAPTLDIDEEIEGEQNQDGVIRRRKRSSSPMGSGGMMSMEMTDGEDGGDSSSMGMDMGMDGGMGMDMGMGMPMNQIKVVDYKLVRFFDFTAKEGKRYRYRVRLLLEDPNFPEKEEMMPNIRTLDEKASKRVSALLAANPATDGKRSKGWYRFTDWSEPTDIVHVAPRRHMLGGTAIAAEQKRIKKTDHEILFDWTEPTGKFLPVLWDKRLASDVPGETEVSRGSVLNFKQDVAVPHPLTNVLKTVKEHQFKTDAFVVDIRGGVPLNVAEDMAEEPVLTPGEFAVVDANGQLIIRNELDDIEDYRRFTYREDKVKKAAAATTDDSMDSDEFEFGMEEDE